DDHGGPSLPAASRCPLPAAPRCPLRLPRPQRCRPQAPAPTRATTHAAQIACFPAAKRPPPSRTPTPSPHRLRLPLHVPVPAPRRSPHPPPLRRLRLPSERRAISWCVVRLRCHVRRRRLVLAHVASLVPTVVRVRLAVWSTLRLSQLPRQRGTCRRGLPCPVYLCVRWTRAGLL
ncbi:uncharacterized protein C8Q71DRAFT_910431, partial [Rhodofomes roseus]